MKIEIETPGQEAYETLNERLVDFNRTKVNWGTRPSRSSCGTRSAACAAARTASCMGAVEIRSVWLDGDLGGRGFGAKSFSAVEDEGAQAGARALLDSYEFQARGFYERLGYVVRLVHISGRCQPLLSFAGAIDRRAPGPHQYHHRLRPRRHHRRHGARPPVRHQPCLGPRRAGTGDHRRVASLHRPRIDGDDRSRPGLSRQKRRQN